MSVSLLKVDNCDVWDNSELIYIFDVTGTDKLASRMRSVVFFLHTF